MPPSRKKRSTKRKKKQKAVNEEGELTSAGRAIFLGKQVDTLNQRLIFQTNKADAAETVQSDLRRQLRELHAAFEVEKQRAFDITADMTRQYKSMRDELIKKINTLEDAVVSYKDQLELVKGGHAEEIRKKDEIISRKDAHIAELKHKMDSMAAEFGDMLKITLDRMSEKIIITGSGDGHFDNGQQHVNGSDMAAKAIRGSNGAVGGGHGGLNDGGGNGQAGSTEGTAAGAAAARGWNGSPVAPVVRTYEDFSLMHGVGQ